MGRPSGLLFFVLACAYSLDVLGAPAAVDQSVRAIGWQDELRKAAVGQKVRLSGVSKETNKRGLSEPELILVLERVRVVAEDAVLQINGEKPEPLQVNRLYFSGVIEGDQNSQVTLILPTEGEIRGLVKGPDESLAITQLESGELMMRPIKPTQEVRPFSCGTDQTMTAPTPLNEAQISSMRTIPPDGYIARVAIETDYEYFQLFNNTTDAINYAADLIAFTSTMYQREASTSLGIVAITLWTSPDDPWAQSGTRCQLYEFGKYWNDNKAGVERTIAHFLSGRDLGGGVAWRGGACQAPFGLSASGCSGFSGYGQYGGDYGVSANLSGNFDMSAPESAWDIIVVAHEIGHNFNSPHTHCYAGIDGNPEPVDQCYSQESGCYSGTPTLPGPSGEGSGTIMSYCHQQSPGLSNISLTLGLDHQFGNEPERVPNLMLGYMAQREATLPGCLTTPLAPGETRQLAVSLQGAGSGNVISNPAGINCGTACTANFAIDSNVNLTATPSSGSIFTGWGGACSGTAEICRVQMSDAKSVSASFAPDENTISLGEALDNAELSWQTSGDAGWQGVQLGDRDAAQSGSISNGESSSLTTTITGPGELQFAWRVSSERNYDFLRLYLNDNQQSAISGETTWQNYSLTLGEGENRVRWAYEKDQTISIEDDAGWVDAVTFIPNSSSLPDLLVTEVTGPLTASAGDSIQIFISVSNQGDTDAGAFRVAFLLSADNVITLADQDTGWWCSFDLGLPKGQSGTCSGEISIPDDTSSGTYFLGAYADSLQVITEKNEANNGLASDDRLTIGGDLADLTVTEVTGPLTGIAGELIEVSASVSNQGDTDAGAFRLTFLLSSDDVITLADQDTGWGCSFDSGLPKGQSRTCSGDIRIPADTPLRTYFLGAYADSRQVVTEKNETNNGLASDDRLTIRVNLPDLIVTEMTGPLAGVAGELIEVSASVSNQGDTDAGAFRLTFLLSTDDVITLADQTTGWGCSFDSGLPKGQSRTCSGDIRIPADTPLRTYFLGAYADSRQVVTEKSETNNGLASDDRLTIRADGVSDELFNDRFESQQQSIRPIEFR